MTAHQESVPKARIHIIASLQSAQGCRQTELSVTIAVDTRCDIIPWTARRDVLHLDLSHAPGSFSRIVVWDVCLGIGLARALKLPSRSQVHPISCRIPIRCRDAGVWIQAIVSHSPSILPSCPSQIFPPCDGLLVLACAPRMFRHSTSSPLLVGQAIQGETCAYSPAFTYPTLMT